MQTSLSDHPATPQERLHDFQQQLEFVQSELIADRGRLQAAKTANSDPQLISKIQEDISMLETAVDRIQQSIHSLKQQLS